MRVAIVGGGASGLSAIKACLEVNIEPICFEMSDNIGGLWNYTCDAIEKERATVYKSTITNTSKEVSAFSDFPMPLEYPNYIHHKQFLDYYHLYAKQYNLIDKIKLKCKVLKVKPNIDYDLTGKWIVEYKNENENIFNDLFDAVMLCTGILWNPYEPFYKGLREKFKGKIIHGSKYKDSKGYEGKNVLIIGMGNSGCDIGVDLTRVASNVYMSVHHGLWCASRVGSNGLPNDFSMNRFLLQIGHYFPKLIQNRIKKRLNERFDQKLYGLKPPENVTVKRITVNDELPSCILTGSIKIKPNVAEFFEKCCLFEDKTVEKDIDVVILATGYDVSIPFIDDVKFKNNLLHLYKSVFPPDKKHPTLAFIGFVGNRLALNPVFELQSRWAVRVFKNLCKLPNLKEMENDILSKTKAIETKYDENRKLVLLEYGLKYSDELAELIGCKPSLFKYLIFNPKLWSILIFGPPTPYQYRLNGPNSNYVKSKNLIFTQNERMLHQFNRKNMNNNSTKHLLISSLSFLLLFISRFLNKNL